MIKSRKQDTGPDSLLHINIIGGVSGTHICLYTIFNSILVALYSMPLDAAPNTQDLYSRYLIIALDALIQTACRLCQVHAFANR